jgi:hypothetical protein
MHMKSCPISAGATSAVRSVRSFSTHEAAVPAFQRPCARTAAGNWANHHGCRHQIDELRVVLQWKEETPHPMRLPRRFDDSLMHAPDARGPVDDALLVAVRA